MKRALNIANVMVFAASVLALLVVINDFAQQPQFRKRIDATKTRAYSLSEQSQQMLANIEGEWKIALLLANRNDNRVLRRQVDEVLSRFSEASPNVAVTRIDPGDPRTIGEYETLLAELRSRYADRVKEYDEHLDAGRDAIEDVKLFAQQQSAMLEQHILLAQDDGIAESVLRDPLERTRVLALLADQADAVLEEVAARRRVSDDQPIPDYNVARSVLVEVLSTAANALYETYESLSTWAGRDELPVEMRVFASQNRDAHERRARELAVTVDPLRHLPDLDLATIGQQLATGEGAIVLGPTGAAVVPADQLLPRSNVRQDGRGGVSFDQRFRGEQLIAAAMRSLLVEHMPMVVFMHASEGSLFRERDRRADLLGVASMLHASRIGVQEWNVATDDKPTPEQGQPVVWVPIPPSQRKSIEPDREELRLINEVKQRIAEGESVLLSMNPSVLPRYGQEDPWANLAAAFGMGVDTSHVIFERFRTGTDTTTTRRSHVFQQFTSDHPIARAVDGQQTHFPLSMAIQLDDAVPGDVDRVTLAQVDPDESRWLEGKWEADPESLAKPGEDQRFAEPLPVAVAASRPNPVERGSQRMVLTGSGSWMLTHIADEVATAGGQRIALMSPGNHELMLASVMWLAGMDELIAQSPTGQEIARLDEISESAGRRWFLLIVVGMPVGCLALGLAVWGARRV